MKKQDNFYCIENVLFNNQNISTNFTVNFEGDRHLLCEGVVYNFNSPSLIADSKNYSFTPLKNNKKDVIIKAENYSVTEHYGFFENSSAVRVSNTVKNTAESPLNVVNFTSGKLMAPVLNASLCDQDRFKIYWCRSGWTNEAQWQESSFSDLGLYPRRDKFSESFNRFILRSEGSWATGRYYPILIVEDKQENKAYFIEHEGACSWEISLGYLDNCIILEAGSSNIHHDGWYITLNKNQEYSTTTALLGAVKGGFEEAVQELIKAKRETSCVNTAEIPLCYNVFMGGIWTNPNNKNLIPLIDACKDLGCDVFCIDAGWFRPENDTTALNNIGDYVPDQNRFGKDKLDGIIKYINKCGMKAGLWFEFEAANYKMNGAAGGKNMLSRNGITISKERGFYDISNKSVQEHLFNAIDRVYKMGMRYIKNDYNASWGIGFGKDYNIEARKQMQAFYSFIKEIYFRYPDIIIENCGSGGMRSDNGTLSNFNIQSTSDQERYYNYPSIASGSIALMPPEKAGIWVYPYASLPSDITHLQHEAEQDVIKRENNKETIIFNMVNGMLGCMYLSGRLDLICSENKQYIEEAIKIYKNNRSFIKNALPVFPLKMGNMGKRQYICAGLINPQKTVLKLCVWKQDAKQDTIDINLNKYTYGNAEVTLAYPQHAKYECKNNILSVTMQEEPLMARFFEIKL